VTVSNISSDVDYRNEQPVSRDSALERTRFTMHAQLVIRVPFRQLDTTLRAMNRLIDYLDYRNVQAKDVALKLLEEQLLQLRQSNYQQQVSSAAQNGKPAPKMDAAERILNSRTAADQSRVDRLTLEDAIQFSTVEIDIYQAAQVKEQMIANTAFRAPQRHFWQELSEAFVNGADFIRSLVIGLVNLWAVVLLVLLVYFGWKRYRRNR